MPGRPPARHRLGIDPRPHAPKHRAAPSRARRLPVQQGLAAGDHRALQIGILVAIIALWEIRREPGWIDGFFWSLPSAIWQDLHHLLHRGRCLDRHLLHVPLDDHRFRDRHHRRLAARPLVLVVAQLRRDRPSPTSSASSRSRSSRSAPLIILVFGIGLASKVAIAVALTIVVSTLTTYSGVKAVDRDGERLFYSLGATRWQVFSKLVVPPACRGSSRCCA